MPLSVIDPSEKLLAEKRPAPIQSTAPVVELEGKRSQPLAPAPIVRSTTTTKAVPIKNERFTEYQARYQPVPDQKKPRTRKAFEAEIVEERVSSIDQFVSRFLLIDSYYFYDRNEKKSKMLNELIQMMKQILKQCR